MLAGLNHNLIRDQSTYHVQTEVCGLQPVRIETQVFVNGRVVVSKQTRCEVLFQQDEADPFWSEELRALMQRQHAAMLRAIQSGLIRKS